MSRWWQWWESYSLSGQRLAVFRFFFFSVLGWDCWAQIAHAPRYGAGGLNISHLPLLDDLLPLPSATWVLGAYLLMSYLAFRIALGGRTRIALPALAAIWNAVYFSSQLDSYQHHYLIGLVLILLCAVPLDTPIRGGEALPPEAPRATWAGRLLTVQISILYFWTAIAKLDPVWLSGETLASQVSVDWARDLARDIGSALGTDALGIWAIASVAVCLGELAVAAGWQIPKLRIPTLLLGLSFHAGVEILGFKIGLFSYFMFTLYLLLVPERVIGLLYRARSLLPRLPGDAAGGAALAVALLAGAILLWRIPFANPWPIVLPITGAALAIELGGDPGSRDRRAVLHLVSCGILLMLHLGTDEVRDYYRYLGGDTRRRGDRIAAIEAYRQVTAIDPHYASGFYRLGDLLAREGDLEAAVTPLERARALDPREYRFHLRAAQIYSELGRGEDAYAAARAVLKLDPGQSAAADIAARWAP